MEYVVEYSSRRTVAIKITNDVIKVSAPLSYNSEQGRQKIREFVETKSEWIKRKTSEQIANMNELVARHTRSFDVLSVRTRNCARIYR